MGGVTFLPEEFSRSNEGGWVLEFPTDYVCPLVKAQGKVSVRVDPLRIAWVHNCLTSGSNSDGFL